MKIWLVSLFDPTPLDDPIYPRFIEIAKAANRRGHKVTHFTSSFRHTSKKHRFPHSHIHEVNPNYEVVFTHSMGYSKNISFRRFYAHSDYAKKLVREMEIRPKPDVVFISMPPLSTIYEVTKWGNRNNVPVVVDIIDPWPDSFIKDVPKPFKHFARLLLAPFYRKLKKALDRSAALTAISNGYLKWASAHHSPQKKTAAFFLAVDFDQVQETQQRFKREASSSNSLRPLRIIYAGSLAASYDIPTILEAARQLDQMHPGVTEFVVTGNGPQRVLVEATQREINNLKYLGWLDRNELMRQYYLADLGLIQHKNNLTQTITYKFFNYMSAGMPLLNSLQSEMAEMIESEGLGMNNEPGNVADLVKNIEGYLNNPNLLAVHRENALKFTAQFGDTKVVYDRLVVFLEEIAPVLTQPMTNKTEQI